MDLILKYFPDLTGEQKQQFGQLAELYAYWNERVNVVSRKDIGNLYEKHVLHSLGIAKVHRFKAGSRVLDAGTGGGFPGIPLAILFPETQFHLADSIGKKIMVAKEVSQALGLNNTKAEHKRVELLKEEYDFVVSRAVTRLAEFYPWVKNKISEGYDSGLKHGILCLKGGDMKEEIKASKLKRVREFSLSEHFREHFFETKKVVYVPAQ